MEIFEQRKQVVETTQDLLAKIGFEARVDFLENGFETGALPVISIESDKDLSMLIGKNGQNLCALEHLIRLIVLKKIDPAETKNLNFLVDINDYRKSRAKYILDIAKTAAQRVVSTRRAEALAPMSAYERRLVHTELASHEDIQTESIGEEPHRRIVIKPLAI